MIEAGRLNHLLEFQKPVKKKDASGAPYTDYEKDFECWGNVKANAGQQVFQSSKYDEKIDGMIIIRYRSDFNADYRVIDNMTNQTLDIRGVYDPNGKQEELHVVFTEVN